MSEKETIEIGGIRFSADEVKNVKIVKDGTEIYLEPNENHRKKMGFCGQNENKH